MTADPYYYNKERCTALLKDVYLREFQSIYVTIIRVSNNGMTRHCVVHCIITDHTGEPTLRNISMYVARACGYRLSKDGRTLFVRGCGFDVAQNIAQAISQAVGKEVKKYVRM